MRDVIVLLRFQFSFLLLPVALLALSLASSVPWAPAAAIFFSLHLLLYPASNGINSYWDRDTSPIGLLSKPPLPPRQLWWICAAMELAGLALVATFSVRSAALLAACVGASHLYSFPVTRLKARGWLGWAWVSFFQGPMVFLATAEMLSGGNGGSTRDFAWGLVTSFVMIGAAYPLSQIYQHHEDSLKGDVTLSLILGVRGTLMFAAMGDAVLGLLLIKLFPDATWWSWLTFVPVAVFGARDRNKASYEYAKKQGLWGAFGLIGFLLLQNI